MMIKTKEQIDEARCFAENIEIAISQMDLTETQKTEVRRNLKLHAHWSKEVEKTIQSALNSYEYIIKTNQII